MVRLQFPNSDVADVLREYETLTGKRVITDNFVQGKVNIFLSKEVPREEAIQIIKISLLMNGFSLVPEDPDIVKVIGQGESARTRRADHFGSGRYSSERSSSQLSL